MNNIYIIYDMNNIYIYIYVDLYILVTMGKDLKSFHFVLIGSVTTRH